MKPWRERIQEARVRGWFNEQDHTDWASLNTCPAAEVAMAYGFEDYHQAIMRGGVAWTNLWSIGNSMNGFMCRRDFNGCERVVEKIEEMALELKRAGSPWKD